MGCFLACFGSTEDAKRRKQRRKVLPPDQRNACSKPKQPSESSVWDYSKTIPSPASEIQYKPGEQLRLSPKKKVTFDSNVKTYEPVLLDEVTDFRPEKSEEGGRRDESFPKSSQSKSSSEDSSVTSTGSYPSYHRYQNCRDSDDEEELDYGDSDLSDEDDEDECSDIEEEFGEDIEDGSRTITSAAAQVFANKEESPIPTSNREEKSAGSNPNARDRSVYIHSVLNPVENLSQWKAIKGIRTPLRPQKENCISNQEFRIPFSVETSFKERSFSSKSGTNHSQKFKQGIAVDASLSNWLGSSETTPVNKTSSLASCVGTLDRSASQGSNSVISHEDRPILGALTVEELKQFSASSSPRKSPCRSPDEMAVIETVGTYWNHSGCVQDSGSASSFKGIPNTQKFQRNFAIA